MPFLIAVILTVPIFATNAIRGMEDKAKAYADELSYGLSLGIQLHLDRTLSESQVLAEALSMLSDNGVFDFDSANKILSSAIHKNKDFNRIWTVIDAQNYKIQSSNDLSALFDTSTSKFSPILQRDNATDNIFMSQVGDIKYTSEKNNSYQSYKTQKQLLSTHENAANNTVAQIVQPFFNRNNEYIGTVGLEVNMSKVKELMDELGEYGVSAASLVSSDAKPIMNFTDNTINESILQDEHLPHHIAQVLSTKKETSETYVNPESGQKVYELIYPIKFEGSDNMWFIQMIYPLDKAKDDVYQSLIFVMLVLALCLTIGISVSTVTAKNIASPITQISGALEQISAGDYNVEIPDLESRDEVGQMAASAQIFKHNAKELVIARQQAEMANQAKTEFLANMSHELRTPMHAMLSYAKLGLDRTDDKESKAFKYFCNITTSGERLLKLLNDLLDLSKLESGKVDFHFNPTNIYSIIESSLTELRSLLSQKNISVITNDGLKLAVIDCDQDKMSQVIINLLSNAIKFSPEGGTIYISVNNCSYSPSIQDGVQISVEDEGIGIPEGELEQVFDKFVQSSKSNKGTGGTGLGLSIAKNIIQAHSGLIWAENRASQGAKFIAVLPKKQMNKNEEIENV